MGYDVQARWLDGKHQIDNVGKPLGDHGESLVEDGENASYEAANLRAQFAKDDFEDVTKAELVISFTEPPRTTATRGGRHVEFGIALGLRTPVFVIGYRENIFHWLPRVHFFETWDRALSVLNLTAPEPTIQ